MNMIRTKAARITDACYAHKLAHNKYLPQFFVCNNNNYTHIQSSYFHYIYTINIALSGEVIST
jgi:hypothetical protein